jgi:hypothetical protein
MLAALSAFGVMLIALTISRNNNTKRYDYVPASLYGILSAEFCCCYFLSLGSGNLLALIYKIFYVVAPFAGLFWF